MLNSKRRDRSCIKYNGAPLLTSQSLLLWEIAQLLIQKTTQT